MKIFHLNLNLLDIRCDGMDNTKEQCSYISIAVPSQTEWLGKKKRTNIKNVIEISVAYWRVHLT